uniref:Amino acid/amide ABC transporter ATP-binding protein 2, HAAT family n=1 Tax=Candidatus Kentrum sp. MB TaxID=2138164 RepID=A0A450XQR9_9GAMM|nr:MAG: amino acid/amide ABC transporter ATP-binding protein 2, HAAT family [Candidatus Kentron sp. MB]VFK31625.1 MAG: amino acid/amide ABC transporter ATP-binding protein 2, HAAT family [Candidatus Kentron sp. MB]VFK75867.1 MAG: amino acid/amide ABC transporter ATP-binding protein 2, HAAT family [Candidatus Kentron sp. MB]
MSRQSLLEIRQLDASYGPVQVLFDISIEVRSGEIISIIGPNGAGKSTVIKAVMNLINTNAGQIIFDGDEITRLATHKITALGIGYVPQGRIVFGNMSVEENLEMGAFLTKNRSRRRSAVETVFQQFPRLRERRKQLAARLSGGEQQMLAIGRALMLNPKLVILDEPSLGLSPKYVDIIFKHLLELKAAGHTLLMVEQNASRALEVSDRGYALDLGRNRYTGTGTSMLANSDVRKMYLGGGKR